MVWYSGGEMKVVPYEFFSSQKIFKKKKRSEITDQTELKLG